MDKQTVFKQISSKGINEKEIEQQYQEAVEFMKSKGVNKDQVESAALSRLMSYFKRILHSPSRTFEGIIYGIDRETDYGAQKQYDESIEMWSVDKDKAIADGYTDPEGNPLYHGTRKPKAGEKPRKIDLEKDRGKPIYLVAKCVEGEQDSDFRRAILTLKSDKFHLNLPLNKLIKFKAIKGTKSNAELYVLSQAQITEFQVIDDKEIPLADIAKKYMKENICKNLKELPEWHKKREDDPNRQVIIKGNVVNIRITGENSSSNLLTIDAPELNVDDKPITCWVPKEIVIDFNEDAQDIIIVGKTGIKEEDEGETAFLNVVGLQCPEIYRVERTEEDVIDPTKIEEVSVQTSTKSTSSANSNKELTDDAGEW